MFCFETHNTHCPKKPQHFVSVLYILSITITMSKSVAYFQNSKFEFNKFEV